MGFFSSIFNVGKSLLGKVMNGSASNLLGKVSSGLSKVGKVAEVAKSLLGDRSKTLGDLAEKAQNLTKGAGNLIDRGRKYLPSLDLAEKLNPAQPVEDTADVATVAKTLTSASPSDNKGTLNANPTTSTAAPARTVRQRFTRRR